MPADVPTPWVGRLAATALPERAGLLEALVVAEFRSALLLEATDDLPYDESYFGQGLTSLGATEIEQKLEATIGRPIDAGVLLNNPTIDHLLDHLRTAVLAEYFQVRSPTSQPAPDQAAQTPDQAAQTPDPAAPAAVSRSMVDDLLKDLYTP